MTIFEWVLPPIFWNPMCHNANTCSQLFHQAIKEILLNFGQLHLQMTSWSFKKKQLGKDRIPMDFCWIVCDPWINHHPIRGLNTAPIILQMSWKCSHCWFNFSPLLWIYILASRARLHKIVYTTSQDACEDELLPPVWTTAEQWNVPLHSYIQASVYSLPDLQHNLQPVPNMSNNDTRLCREIKFQIRWTTWRGWRMQATRRGILYPS